MGMASRGTGVGPYQRVGLLALTIFGDGIGNGVFVGLLQVKTIVVGYALNASDPEVIGQRRRGTVHVISSPTTTSSPRLRRPPKNTRSLNQYYPPAKRAPRWFVTVAVVIVPVIETETENKIVTETRQMCCFVLLGVQALTAPKMAGARLNSSIHSAV